MELVYGVLIFEDMAAILLITVLTPIAAGLAPEAGAVLDTVGQLGLFVVGFVIVGLSLVPRLFRWVAGFAPTETLLVAGVGLCFVAAWLADAAGYSVALGAFLGGALVAESGAAQKIEPLVQPLRDLFGAVFFVSVGMLIEPALLLSNAGLILLFTVVLMAGKIGGVALGGFLSDGRVRPAVRAGLSMAQVGEFSFIIAGIGVSAGAVGPELLAVAVGVSVLTISTTPLLVRSSARAAHAVHRRMPKALQAFVTFYGAWLDGLRRVARSESSFAALRRTLLWMLVDSVCIVAVAVGMRLVRPSVVAFLHARAGLERDAGQAWVTLATVVLMVPFAVGLFRLGRGLGDTLAGVALPPVEPGRADPAAAPRRAFTLTLQVGVLFAVGLPLVALVQPFLPVLGPLAFMAVAIGAAGVLLWRRMIRLQGHMTAGAEALIEALSRQVASDTGHEAKPLSEECGEMFAGLGRVRSAQIPDAAPTLGRSLGELDVAALTGAQVVAIRRCGRLLPMPGADQRLEAGDEIALLGCEAAVAAARRLLEEGDLPESGAAGAAGAAFGCDQ